MTSWGMPVRLLIGSSQERLLRLGELYRRGRGRVLWVSGVLYFGGSLFLLCNVLDFVIDGGTAFRTGDLWRVAGFVIFSTLVGYLYGLGLWRNLSRTFGSNAVSNDEPVQ